MSRPFSEDLRFRLLRLLERNPLLSQREIARDLGIALGSVNLLLAALAAGGLVERRVLQTPRGKRRQAYVLTPDGTAERSALTAGFLRRKQAEYEALKSELETLQAELSVRTAPQRQQLRAPAPKPDTAAWIR